MRSGDKPPIASLAGLARRSSSRVVYPARVLFVGCQERSALEAQHKSKINAEINRYQAMVQEKEELNRKWDEEASQAKPTSIRF